MKVTHFHRRPIIGHKSIERLFAGLRKAMPNNVECTPHVCPHFSKGIIPRLKNMRDAARHQSQINHITGDVHYLALALDGRRTVLTIHDCAPLERLRGLRRTIFKWFWFELPVRRCRLVSVISESARRELLRHVRCNSAKIHVVPDCVGDDFAPSPKRFNEVEPEILQVGTKPNKNLERLTQAVAGLPCRLNIIGNLTAAQSELLMQCNVRYSNIPNATDTELLAAYQNCDLVAFVSTYEGFGLPIVEANAIGRAVVTSNILSMPEVAGDSACLVNPFDAAAIRSGIQRIWLDANCRQRLVEAGFENAKRFASKTVAEKYATLYHELVTS